MAARFQKSKNQISQSSGGNGGGMTSKIGKTQGQMGAIGGGGGSSGKGNPQVIYNGRIVTPQSLLTKKSGFAQPPKPKESLVPLPPPAREITTISETAGGGSAAAMLAKKGAAMNASKRTLPKGGRQASMNNVLAGVSERPSAEETVILCLAETPTEIAFGLPSLIVSTESREAAAVEEMNVAYDAVVESHKNQDGLRARAAQTINNPQKSQNEMAAPHATADMGVNASSYEIKDAVDGMNEPSGDAATGGAGFISAGSGVSELEHVLEQSESVYRFISDTVTVASYTQGCLLDTTAIHRPVGPQERRGGKKQTEHTRKKSMASHALESGTSHAFTQGGESGSTQPVAAGTDKGSGGESKDMAGPPGSKTSGHSASDVGSTAETENLLTRAKANHAIPAVDSAAVLREKRADEVMGSHSMLKKLGMLERAVQQNAYRDFMLLYRDSPEVDPLVLAAPTTVEADNNGLMFGGAMGSRLGSMLSANSVPPGSTGEEGSAVLGADGSTEEPGVLGDLNASSEESSKVQKLFTYFSSDLSKGRAVSSMAWSAINPDLLAVGYGKYVPDMTTHEAMKSLAAAEAAYGPPPPPPNATGMENYNSRKEEKEEEPRMQVDPTLLKAPVPSEEDNHGLVLFWSLRNPDHPEKVLRTPHPVTALDFSTVSPAILAVGMFNGDVAIYDVRREHDWGKPLESAEGMTGGHSDPVWQLKWLVKNQDRLETLVSISTDGNVLEWSFKKGIVVTQLMQLKRAGVGDGWISRQAAGLCFDFHPDDPTVYVTGTEEGNMHRCSVSYSEQYLETYEPHHGPVYKVKFSPHWSDMFLTCSADWSMSLYHVRKRNSVVNLHGTGEDFSINDVCWCPGNSTCFAAITSDAKLQLWDIAESAIDPVVSVDTNLDYSESPAGTIERANADLVKEVQEAIASLKAANSNPLRKVATMKGRPGAAKAGEDDKEGDGAGNISAVSKLLKNLNSGLGKRALTSVLFGIKSPVVAVGDNRGTVIVYRILDPVTVTHEPPAMQMEKLQRTLARQDNTLADVPDDDNATLGSANPDDHSLSYE